MWTKIVTSSAFGLFLTGCGNAVGEAQDSEETATSTDIRSVLDSGAKVTGQVPEHIDPDIAPFQARLVADLKKGVPVDIFEGATPPLERSIKKTGGPKPIAPFGPDTEDGKYVMYLVKNPVSRLSNSAVLDCSAGDLYRATIAAKPYLRRTPARTEAPTENIHPYDVDICDGENDITYALVI